MIPRLPAVVTGRVVALNSGRKEGRFKGKRQCVRVSSMLITRKIQIKGEMEMWFRRKAG